MRLCNSVCFPLFLKDGCRGFRFSLSNISNAFRLGTTTAGKVFIHRNYKRLILETLTTGQLRTFVSAELSTVLAKVNKRSVNCQLSIRESTKKIILFFYKNNLIRTHASKLATK